MNLEFPESYYLQNQKSGRIDGHNSNYRSGSQRIPRKVRYEIHVILQNHREKSARSEKSVGYGTQEKRSTIILGFFSDLFFLKYKIESVRNLKQKHLRAVFHFLEAEGQAPATLQNKISVIRTFCEWIGKDDMVKDSKKYVRDARSVRRTTVAQEDRSWNGKGFDAVEKIEQIRMEDGNVAVWLELCWAFGLRVQEAVMLRPVSAHEENHLQIRDGTKGDRARLVPIENFVQEDVLERAKKMADQKNGWIGPRGKTVQQKLRRLYYVMEKCGVNLAGDGITAHGLRHQYMQESYKRLMGVDSPIKGGNINEVSNEDFYSGTLKLVERAGHSRTTIGASYYGSRRRKGSPKSEQPK